MKTFVLLATAFLAALPVSGEAAAVASGEKSADGVLVNSLLGVGGTIVLMPLSSYVVTWHRIGDEEDTLTQAAIAADMPEGKFSADQTRSEPGRTALID